MKNDIHSDNDLPSMRKLITSTVLAIFIAAIALVTVVLPAEYGLDPTGIGEALGLKKMGEIKVSLAAEAALEDKSSAEAEIAIPVQSDSANMASASGAEVDSRSDKVTLTLEPNQGKEIKLAMNKSSVVNYSWYTDGGLANFDAHADSEKLQIKYHSYEKGKLKKSTGVMEAAFDGNHGWFWRNRTSEPMTVTLEVSGSYTEVIRY